MQCNGGCNVNRYPLTMNNMAAHLPCGMLMAKVGPLYEHVPSRPGRRGPPGHEALRNGPAGEQCNHELTQTCTSCTRMDTHLFLDGFQPSVVDVSRAMAVANLPRAPLHLTAAIFQQILLKALQSFTLAHEAQGQRTRHPLPGSWVQRHGGA